MKRLVFLFTTTLLLTSCGGAIKPAPEQAVAKATIKPIDKIKIKRDSITTIQVTADNNQTYSIYYPKTALPAYSCPVIICFDPHGDGSLPITKYKKWANKFGIAIAGSNSSKNGISPNDGLKIADNLITDLNTRVGFSKKNMVLCGFSGGAKVAINAIVSNTDIPNLIYAGAVTQLNASHPLNILGFAGDEDMNYTDLLQFNESIKRANPNAVLIEFNGKHEWPDAYIFERAFYWTYFKCSVKDSPALKKYIEEYTGKLWTNTIKQKVGLLLEYEENQQAKGFLNGIADVSAYEGKMKFLSNESTYKAAVAEKAAVLEKEANQKTMLVQAFQSQGIEWWQKVTKAFQSSTNPSDKRLLGFISLASYSYSSQLIGKHNLDAAERVLAIYELCDPTNTDQLYFHAVLYAQKANNKLALKYLQKAAANNFTDWQKIEAEPAFSPLKADPDYTLLVAALKKASK